MSEQKCPDKAALLEFAAGRGEGSLRSAIQAHLEQCQACRQVVSTAADVTTDQQPRDAQSPGSAGAFLSGDPTDNGSSDQITPELSDGEYLESRFDSRLLEPAREAGALGHLGKYVVLDVLGYGGMGVVLRAKDEQLLRTVAIKVMSRDLACSGTSRRRFIREARAAAAINHPNVVTIHAVEEYGGTPFLVMELITGESLRDRLRHRPKLEIVDVISIAYQVASGLAAAHAQGVIHRDIKPGNIMLEDEISRVKITDFGLARVAVDNVDLTSNHIGIGTPAFMSPEQVKGEAIDHRTDLFALGCVIYSMLHGHSPFHGRTALEVARNVADREPSPAMTETGVPLFLSELIDRLLQKSPDKRYQTAAEVAELLRQDLELLNRTPTDKLGQLVHRSTRSLSTWPNWARRHSLGLAASALAVFSAFLAFGGRPPGWFGARPLEQVASLPGGLSATNVPGAIVADLSVDSRGPKKLAAAPGIEPLLTVSKSGAADSRSISEALRRIAPGGEIRILDAAEYEEPLRIADSQRFAGIRLVALAGATIRSRDTSGVVTIRGVPGVRIEGLKIIAPQVQVALEINGACPGLQLEKIQVERVTNPDGTTTSNAAVVLRGGAAGTAEQPIVLRGLAIRSANVGLAIVAPSADDASAAPRHIVLEESLIQGASRESSTLLALLRRCEDIVIRRNIFSQGLAGVSIVAEGTAAPARCQIEHNTWHGVRTWLGWSGPMGEALDLQISNNLVVDARAYAPALREVAAAPGNEARFRGNLAVNQRGDGAASFAPLATDMPDFPLVSIDASHPDYLRPDFASMSAAASALSPIPGRYSNISSR